MLVWWIYLAGVALGLLVMRDRLPSRLLTATMWPLGPMAFVVVVGVLLLTAAALWPVPVIGTAALLGLAAWWWL
jgi:hypothetical protein